MGKEEIQESEPLRIYLNEIGEIPLLDETEEKELGRRISDGDESARARLEEGNLRLVVSIAKHYTGRGLPLISYNPSFAVSSLSFANPSTSIRATARSIWSRIFMRRRRDWIR